MHSRVQNVPLCFFFCGLCHEDIAVQNQTSVNVMLSPEVRGLDEVVVVGYGTQKKANLTAAVDQVTS